MEMVWEETILLILLKNATRVLLETSNLVTISAKQHVGMVSLMLVLCQLSNATIRRLESHSIHATLSHAADQL